MGQAVRLEVYRKQGVVYRRLLRQQEVWCSLRFMIYMYLLPNLRDTSNLILLSYCFRLYHTQRSLVTIVELLASLVVCIFVVFPALKPEVCNCFISIAKLRAKNRYVIFQSTISSVFVFNMLIKTRASRGTGNFWSEF